VTVPEASTAATGPNAPAAPLRVDGYAPIGQYGAIGDERGVALVASDGAVDWLCWPAHDSGSIFGALLDPARAGTMSLRPAGRFESEQRYLDKTNVLETTFSTDAGVVRLTDAVTTDGGRLLPWHELVRRVECISGSVDMHWSVEPRFGYGTADHSFAAIDDGYFEARSEAGDLGVSVWAPWKALHSPESVNGEATLREGESATLALVYTPRGEPVPRPTRDEVEDRLERTAAAWHEWLDAHDYEGPWRESVERSLLALRLLSAPSGAVVAAPTTSLPERIGGDRNYDYRHAWPRDTAFMLDALLNCGLREPAHGALAWLLRALEDTHPRVQPIYRLSGEVLDHQFELPLRGYRDSKPVREGNDAAGQLQLGAYGDLLHTAWLYTQLGNRLDRVTGTRLAETVDLLTETWTNEDSSIWELPEHHQYTASKMGCWLAFDRAAQLVAAGQLPDHGRRQRYERERDEVARWVEEHCWSEGRQSYLQAAGSEGLDVATVLMGRMGYHEVSSRRFQLTLEAVRRELMSGPYVHRYSGMENEEGAFVACSFWVVEAMGQAGDLDAACELMEQAIGMGNHLGLMSEEVDPATSELLGNFPQALSHLALINAATILSSHAS
jgi:GH15 family glucan-1,4-alpha-glucosidase